MIRPTDFGIGPWWLITTMLVGGCSSCGSPSGPAAPTDEPGPVEEASPEPEAESGDGSPLRGWVKMSGPERLTYVDERGRQQFAEFVDGARVLRDGVPVDVTALRTCQTVTIEPTKIEVLDGALGAAEEGQRDGYAASIAEVDYVGSTIVVRRRGRTHYIELLPDTTELTRQGEPVDDMEALEQGQRVWIEPLVVTIESAPDDSAGDTDVPGGFYRGRVTARYPTNMPGMEGNGTTFELALDGGESISFTFDVTERTNVLQGSTPADVSTLFECRSAMIRPRTFLVLDGAQAMPAPDDGSYDAEVIQISRDDFRLLLRIGDAEEWTALRSQEVITRGAESLGFGVDPFRKMELLNVGDRVRITPLVVIVGP